MKLRFRLPARAHVLVFDRFGTQGLMPLLSPGNYTVFENRQSELNLWVVLLTIIGFRFSWRDYCVTYIRLARAKIVITCIDSNATFYSLKAALPNVYFVAVQNSIRGNASPVKNGDLWSMLKRSEYQPPTVDLVATFGQAHSDLYKQHIRCDTVEIGSTRNNMVSAPLKKSPNTPCRVGLISGYVEFPRRAESPSDFVSNIAWYYEDREVTVSDYVTADKQVAALIASASQAEGWDFRIVGKRPPDLPFEREFYANACGSAPHLFMPKQAEDFSYNTLDQCDIVVTVDSTLGYEMIARGSRVLFVTARAHLLGGPGSEQYRFGFPRDFGNEGPFWTSTLDAQHLARVMKSLLAMSDREWHDASEFVRQDLMVFDPDNTKLRAIIAKFD